MKEDRVAPLIDCVLTFEELEALFSSRDFDITAFEEIPLERASYFGRIFGRSEGLSAAVRQALKEQGIEGFDLKAVPCNGIEACRIALLKASKRMLDGNFIEGMACIGGCVGGAGCLTHADRNSAAVDLYAKDAGERTVTETVKRWE